MKTFIALAAFAIGLSASTTFAQSGADLGTLTCQLKGVDNMVVYSKEEFDCEFKMTTGTIESYTGQIKSYGLDLTVKKDMTLVWAVLAPTNNKYKQMSLKGTYVGGSVDVAVGAGLGAKILVGGGENSFTLQPLSVSGIEGAGASLGVQSFELR